MFSELAILIKNLKQKFDLPRGLLSHCHIKACVKQIYKLKKYWV